MTEFLGNLPLATEWLSLLHQQSFDYNWNTKAMSMHNVSIMGKHCLYNWQDLYKMYTFTALWDLVESVVRLTGVKIYVLTKVANYSENEFKLSVYIYL